MTYNPNQPRDPGGEGGGQWIKSGTVSDTAKAAGFKDDDELRAELDLLAQWPQYADMSDEELLNVQRVFSEKVHGNTLKGLVGVRSQLQHGEWESPSGQHGPLTDQMRTDMMKVEERYSAINRIVNARRASAEFARIEFARQEVARTGNLSVDKTEFADMLAKQGDVYADAGYQGDYNPDLFRTSDLSGKPIRHYVTLPDGRIAHPDELHESRSRGRLIVVHNLPAPTDRPRYRSDVLSDKDRARFSTMPPGQTLLPSGGVKEEFSGGRIYKQPGR